MNWINTKDKLPEAKYGQQQSEAVLVHYDEIPNEQAESWGIAYYHYNPWFRNPGFVGLNDPRTPTHWMAIPPIKVPTIHEKYNFGSCIHETTLVDLQCKTCPNINYHPSKLCVHLKPHLGEIMTALGCNKI